MASKQSNELNVDLKNKFWTGFVFGLGFTLGSLIILFFLLGIIAIIINNISPGLLF
jgi:hypothetical protein